MTPPPLYTRPRKMYILNFYFRVVKAIFIFMILIRKQLAPVGGAVSRAFSIQFELRLGKNTARENPETGFRELE